MGGMSTGQKLALVGGMAATAATAGAAWPTLAAAMGGGGAAAAGGAGAGAGLGALGAEAGIGGAGLGAGAGATTMPLTLAGGAMPAMSTLGGGAAGAGLAGAGTGAAGVAAPGFFSGLAAKDVAMPGAMLLGQGLGALTQPPPGGQQPQPRQIQIPSSGNFQALPQGGISPLAYGGGQGMGMASMNPAQLMMMLQQLQRG